MGGNEGGHVASSTEREAGNLVGAVEEEEATSAKQGLNNQDGGEGVWRTMQFSFCLR